MHISDQISNADLVNELNQRYNFNLSLLEDGIALPSLDINFFSQIGEDYELLEIILRQARSA